MATSKDVFPCMSFSMTLSEWCPVYKRSAGMTVMFIGTRLSNLYNAVDTPA
jgi:hypothetical protein